MAKGHDFGFEGGKILRKICVAWFVSYAYYNHIDDRHLSWKNSKFSNLSINTRVSNFDRSIQYHEGWLREVLKMQQLDKHKNKCGLKSSQIKAMATDILNKISTTSH